MSAIAPELCDAAYADELPSARRRLSGGRRSAPAALSDAHSSFSANRWTDTNRGDTVVELRGEFAGRSANKETATTVPTAIGMVLRILPLYSPRLRGGEMS